MIIYKGCCHGCIYCDSRSKCYRVDNFDAVRAKQDALAIINMELKTRKPGFVGTGSMSDPYNPFEKELKLTGNALELINNHGFGVSIATKSDLITRDIDVLKDISKHSPVCVKLTIIMDCFIRCLKSLKPINTLQNLSNYHYGNKKEKL